MAKANLPVRRRVSSERYKFKGTGVAADDTVDFANLYTAILNSGRQATIEIADRSQPALLDAAVPGFANGISIQAPIVIVGETRHSRIKLEGGFHVNFGGHQNHLIPVQSVDPNLYARGTCSDIAVGAWQVVVPSATWLSLVNGGAGPLVGDMISLSSDNSLVGCDPHEQGGINSPGETHRIARVSVATVSSEPQYTITLCSPVRDAMTSARICWIKTLKNCGVEGLTFETSYGGNLGHNQTTFLSARRTQGFFVNNIYADKMPGTMVLWNSIDPTISGVVSYGTVDNLGDYGIAVGDCTGWRVNNVTLYNYRHPFTTGGQTLTASNYTSMGAWSGATAYSVGQWVSYTLPGAAFSSKFVCIQAHTNQTPASSTAYWLQLDRVYGTPCNGVLSDSKAYVPGNGVASFTGWDFHSSGTHNVVRDCEVHSTVSGFNSYGYSSRARTTRFERCTARGPGSQWMTGFHLRGADNEVIDCTGDNLDRGVFIDCGVHGGAYHGRVIADCSFTKVFEPAVIVNKHATNGNVINNVHVTGLRVRDSSSGNSPPYSRAAVAFQGGTGHRVRGSHLDKQTSGGNQFSIDFTTLTTADVSPIGNYCTGYGTGVAGFDSDTASGAAFESAYAAKNYTS